MNQYEINIAMIDQDGKTYSHLFATSLRSIRNRDELRILLLLFRDKFPKPQYKIEVNFTKREVFSVSEYSVEPVLDIIERIENRGL